MRGFKAAVTMNSSVRGGKSAEVRSQACQYKYTFAHDGSSVQVFDLSYHHMTLHCPVWPTPAVMVLLDIYTVRLPINCSESHRLQVEMILAVYQWVKVL